MLANPVVFRRKTFVGAISSDRSVITRARRWAQEHVVNKHLTLMGVEIECVWLYAIRKMDLRDAEKLLECNFVFFACPPFSFSESWISGETSHMPPRNTCSSPKRARRVARALDVDVPSRFALRTWYRSLSRSLRTTASSGAERHPKDAKDDPN